MVEKVGIGLVEVWVGLGVKYEVVFTGLRFFSVIGFRVRTEFGYRVNS